jgi:hypothetical protein
VTRTRWFVLRLLGSLLGLALLSGCHDSPTLPDAIQRLAGGEEWVAVSAPQELPRLETWLPYLSRESEGGRAAYRRVRELDRLSQAAQREGRLTVAGELRREAQRVAVVALERQPDARVVQRALHSIEFWCDRVAAQVELRAGSELGEAHAQVMAARTLATEQLLRGDTASAVLLIAAAAERIREHTPEAVALRVLQRAQERLDPTALEADAADRAGHLLGNARQELISGDPRRALQRALYALQILEGNELRTVTTGPDSLCVGPGC